MIEYRNLHAVNRPYEDAIRQAVDGVLHSGWYIRGSEVDAFEREYAAYIGTRYCVGVGNGLDALTLIYQAYMAMGLMSRGDEVIVPANTYIASILAITACGLTPVLVEPNPETLQIDDRLIEQAISPRTKSVMIVHLYGRCAYTERIGTLCREYGLKLVEDNAQAHGCRYRDRVTGSLGDAAGHSFYPTKNLGALGDAGAVTTDDGQLADIVRALGNYGSNTKYVFDYKGRNSRMDELQAAVLRIKLPHLDAANQYRSELADYYYRHLHNPLVTLPRGMFSPDNVWHIFPVLCESRDQLADYLLSKGIETQIHYPIAPHQQKCYQEWSSLHFPISEMIHRCELSLPLSPSLSLDEVRDVVAAVMSYKN